MMDEAVLEKVLDRVLARIQNAQAGSGVTSLGTPSGLQPTALYARKRQGLSLQPLETDDRLGGGLLTSETNWQGRGPQAPIVLRPGESLVANLDAAGTVDFVSDWLDTGAKSLPDGNDGQISGTGDTELVATPSGQARAVGHIYFTNTTISTRTLTVRKKKASGAYRVIRVLLIDPNQTIELQDAGWKSSDDSQYLRLLGRTGGQVAYGGSAGADSLNFLPTTALPTTGRVIPYYLQLPDVATNPSIAGDIFRNSTAFKFFDTAVRKIAPFKDETPTNGYFPRWNTSQWESVRFGLNNKISPSISADQNNWSPTGLSSASVIRVTATGSGRNITGLTAGADGDVIVIENIGALFVSLKHLSGSSSAANQFNFGGTDISLWTGDSVVLEYDGASSQWRCIAKHLGFLGCRVNRGTDQLIGTSSNVAMQFSAERYDIGDFWNSGANTRLTPPAPGKYRVGGNLRFEANATGVREIFVRINGTTTIGYQGATTVSANIQMLNVNTSYDFAAGDYAEIVVFQSSGGNLNIVSVNSYGIEGWMERLAS